jgi:hypothetical protein
MEYTRCAAIRSLLRDQDPAVIAQLQQDLSADPALLQAVWADALAPPPIEAPASTTTEAP